MGAGFSRVKTWGAEVLTYSDLNAEFDNILNNLIPAYIDDESATDAAARATTDPYPAASLSKATSLQGELQQVRYLINQLQGGAYWYQDPVDFIWIPADDMTPTTTAGCATIASLESSAQDLMANYLAFDTGSVEYASFNLVMPPNWNRSTVKVKFYWMPGSDSGSVGETVEWAIMGGAINDTNGTFDVALGTPQVISDAVKTGESAVVHISGATPAITIGNVAPGPGVDDLVRLKVYRNVGGTDNFGYDAFLLGVLIQYTKGTTSNTAW